MLPQNDNEHERNSLKTRSFELSNYISPFCKIAYRSNIAILENRKLKRAVLKFLGWPQKITASQERLASLRKSIPNVI